MPTQNFKVGEMLNKRTPNSKTWINFDGSYTTEIYNAPVHFEDENGNLHNIDTDLFDEADLDLVDEPVAKEGRERFREARERAREEKRKNKLNRDLYDFQGLKVPFDVRLPRNFKRGYVVGKGKNKLKFKPIGASPSKGYVDEDKKNFIHYQDAWNDTDVTLELTTTGVKETIILKTDRAPVSFSFEVDGPLEDDLTSGELKLQPAWLQDANGEKRDVSQTIRREGDQTFIDLVADVSGLVYPIEIDPTVSITSTSYIFDTYIRKSAPYDPYYLTTTLKLGGVYYQNESEVFKQEYTPMFNIDYKSAIPAGAILTNATLDLNQTYVSDGSKSYQIQVYEYDYSKITSSSTYDNTIGTGILGTYMNDYGGSNFNGPLSISIKNVLQSAINTNKAKLGLYLKFAIIDGFYVHFASIETADTSIRPRVSVTYNAPPTAPTVTSPNGGETWNSLHTITWTEAVDDKETNLAQGGTASTVSSGGADIGQSFFVTENGFLKEVTIYVANGSTGNFTMKVKTGSFNGTVIATKTSAYVYSSASVPLTFTLDTPLSVTNGQVLYFLFTPSGAASFDVVQNGNYTGGAAYWSSASQPNYDLKMIVVTTSSQSLQYQIQLSTNNGGAWKNIVSLTAAGATSYQYDFINEPETSTAKIRIRAYDGASYGPWDESNGVFTIIHNQAPTAPTNLSPSGGASADRAKVNRLSWLHNDPNAGDPQSKFDLQWRLQGAGTWNTITQATPNQFYNVPANTFPKGTIEWQVRTYDQAGLSSPYSNIQTFFAGDKPATPVITNPTNNSTVAVARPTVQWSSDGQTAYQVKVYDSAGTNLLWDSGAINSTNKAQTVLYDLANNTTYQIQVTIKNADGLWSDPAVSNITVSYTPPAVPIVATAKGEGIITVSIDNPTPTGTEPNVSYNSVFRRKQGESIWTRIATNIPAEGSFIDYTPASGQVYEYYVRAWGDNGTYSDSLIVSESISFTGVWLHEAANPLTTLHQFKLVSDRSENWQPTAAMMQFAGRRLPVAEYDDTEQQSVSVKLNMLKNSGDREAIERLIKSKNTLCYRDARGRKIFCHAFQLPMDDEFYGNTVSLTFEEVSYTEEV